MAFADVIIRRLFLTIRYIKDPDHPPNLQLSGDSKLGVPPVGWDAAFIQGEFCGHVMGKNYGFDDLLKGEPFPCNTLARDTTIAALAGMILARSVVKTLDDYRTNLELQVHNALFRDIANLKLPPIDPGEIEPDVEIKSYLTTKNQIESLKALLNAEFKKYLLTPVDDFVVNSTVGRGVRRIVLSMTEVGS